MLSKVFPNPFANTCGITPKGSCSENAKKKQPASKTRKGCNLSFVVPTTIHAIVIKIKLKVEAIV